MNLSDKNSRSICRGTKSKQWARDTQGTAHVMPCTRPDLSWPWLAPELRSSAATHFLHWIDSHISVNQRRSFQNSRYNRCLVVLTHHLYGIKGANGLGLGGMARTRWDARILPCCSWWHAGTWCTRGCRLSTHPSWVWQCAWMPASSWACPAAAWLATCCGCVPETCRSLECSHPTGWRCYRSPCWMP